VNTKCPLRIKGQCGWETGTTASVMPDTDVLEWVGHGVHVRCALQEVLSSSIERITLLALRASGTTKTQSSSIKCRVQKT
jgi:hypothetical protein